MFAVVVAACGSDDRHYDPPPPEAVASCQLVQNDGTRVVRHALWFDAASRLIQIDGYGNESTKVEYDDQDRVVRVSSPSLTTSYTYEPARVTSVDSSGKTFVYDLGADGLVAHSEGPEELAASDRDRGDYQYDGAGHMTAVTTVTHVPVPESRVTTTHSYSSQLTYDAQGRLASIHSTVDTSPTGFRDTGLTYSEAPGAMTIALTSDGAHAGTWTYELDDEGRVVHAAVGDGMSFQSGYAYAYDADTITANPTEVPAGYTARVTTSTGDLCPGVSTTFGPHRPLSFDFLDSAAKPMISLPNPPVDYFNQRIY